MKFPFFTPKIQAEALRQADIATRTYAQARQDYFRREQERRDQEKAAIEQAERDARAAQLARERAAELEEERKNAVYRDLNFLADPSKLANILTTYRRGDQEHQDRIREFYARTVELHLEDDCKIDFAGLPFDGKAMFLPVYLGLTVGKDYPRLDFQRSDPATRTFVYVTHHGPADARSWREHVTLINRYLGGRWQVEELDGTSIRLWSVPELASSIPFNRSYLRDGAIFMGFRIDDGQPYYWPFKDMTHTLVAGMNGKGKSVQLRQMMCSISHNLPIIDEAIIVDAKGGVEMMRFAAMSPKYRVIKDYDDLPDMIDGLVKTMNARFAEMLAVGAVKYPGRYIFLIIDEYAAISLNEPPKTDKERYARHQRMMENLNLLAAQARAANIRIYAQLQKPVDKYIETSVRENLPSTLCFMIQSKVNASTLFGELAELPADPTNLPNGQYIFKNGADNQVHLLQATFCDPDDLDTLKSCIPPAERS
jgi:hypothetical protein